MENTVNIALASDERYSVGLLVTAVSISINASKDCNLLFLIVDGGLRDETYLHVVECVTKFHSNVRFRRHKLTGREFCDYPSWRGNALTYARYLVPDLLYDCDYAIYSDVDTLWEADVCELWGLRNPNVAIWGAHDELAINSEAKWWSDHGLLYDDVRYFNAGVVMMNLDWFRRETISKKCGDFICDHPDVLYPDQCALNYVLQENCVIVPDKWMRFTWCTRKGDGMLGVVFHFASDLPWIRDHWFLPISDSVLRWFKVLSVCEDVSVRVAMRMYLSRWEIVRGRFVYLMVNSIFSGVCGKILKCLGRDESWVLVQKICTPL